MANNIFPDGDDRFPQGRTHEAFESGNARDAYSSVSHLKGNLDSLSFAIGLREEGGQEGALERLLPMLKIQPRPAGAVSPVQRNTGYNNFEDVGCVQVLRSDLKVRCLLDAAAKNTTFAPVGGSYPVIYVPYVAMRFRTMRSNRNSLGQDPGGQQCCKLESHWPPKRKYPW